MSQLVSPRAELLFVTALDLAEEDRLAYLEDQCAADGTLRAEVESLIKAATTAEVYFTNLADQFGITSVLRGDAELPGDRAIGPYQLIRLIGRGGMGAVYLAERADQQFEQLVALKILPFGVGGDEARQRFFAERQILASLVHANVARLLDGGITDEGTPYFVMDYVAGEPLDAYCDRENLDVGRRLDLFKQIGDAVQYAHQNLIVHRDLKPANVLVEATGTAKLLDFGIAKALAPDAHYAPTRTGVLPMTSLYASPEMLKREAVTTLSDVYALGVLLYELLVGRHPYDLPADAAAPDVWRQVCEVDPVPPSRAALLGEHRQEAARQRGATPQKLSQKLAGDLDTIIAKAMHKTPERRYSSVEQMIADLERHRAGLPVLAQPPTLAYRLGKFVRRRKGLVAAGVAALMFVAAIVYQSERVSREAERANREADVAQQVSEYLVSVFSAADPSVASGDTITALELLDQGAAKLDAGLIEDPQVAARLRSTVAYVYAQLAAFPKAERLYDQAIAYQRATLSIEHPDTLETQTRMGLMYTGQGRFREAAEMLRTTFLVQGRTLGPGHASTLKTQGNLAVAHAQLGDFAEAVRLGESLVEVSTTALGPGARETLNYVANLGIFYKLDGRWDEAELRYLQALQGLERIHPGDHEETLGIMQNLADLYSDQERIDEAKPLYERTIAGSKRVFGDQHPDVTRVMTNFANMHLSVGNYDAAENLYDESLAIQRSTLGENHFETLNGKMKLGELYARQGRFEDAENLLLESLAGHRQVYGNEHRKTIGVVGRLHEVYVAMGNETEMRRLGRERLALWQKLAAQPLSSVQDKVSYGWNLATIRPEDLRDGNQAVEVLTAANEETNYSEARFVYGLAVAYKQAGQLAQAIETQRRAIALVPESAAGMRENYEKTLADFLAENP